MLKISIQIDERDLDALSRDLVDAAAEQIAEQVRGAIESYECPEHNQQPTVTISVSGDQINISAEACCEQAKSDVEAILAGLGGDDVGERSDDEPQ